MENITCLICHEGVRVPVRLFFPCQKTSEQMTCNSVQRYCLKCAQNYLELNKPIYERSPSVKCLLCPARLYPQQLTEQAYEKDFLLMQLDTRTNIQCPYEPCTFTGTHYDVNTHVSSQCPYREKKCTLCQSVFMAREETDHEQVCIGRVMCEFCDMNVPFMDFTKHLQEEHNIIKCKECMMTFFQDETDDHQCPMRFVRCLYCIQQCRAMNYKSHILTHIHYLQNMNFQKEYEISQNNKHIQTMMNEIETFEI